MAIICCNMLILIVFVIRKKKMVLELFGVSTIVLFYLFCIIRMVLPLEFSFARPIFFSAVYNKLYEILNYHYYSLNGYKISVLNSLVFLCLSIGLVLLGNYFHNYIKVIKNLRNLEIIDNQKYFSILNQVCRRYNKKNNFRMRYCNEISVPMGIGICKKTILLPKKEYSEEFLFYILSHECNHFFNRDLLMKFLSHIFCYIFWWNPFVYFLKKDLEYALEIKCDLSVAKIMKDTEKSKYLTVILQEIKNNSKKINKKEKAFYMNTTALFDVSYIDQVKERFQIVVNSKSSRKNKRNAMIVGIFFYIFVLLASYGVVFQSHYEFPKSESSQIINEVDSSKVYIIKDHKGDYYIKSTSTEKQPITKERAEEFNKNGIRMVEERGKYD